MCASDCSAQISFTQHQVRVRVWVKQKLAIRFSSVRCLIKLTGPAQYLGKKNLLAFDFTHMQLSVLPFTVASFVVAEKEMNFYDQPIAKLLLCVLGD